MIAFLAQLWAVVTFKAWRTARSAAVRRERYEFLKSEISKRHFGGFAGLIVDFPGRKLDIQDLASFKPPMYAIVKNADMKWCIFWDRARMAREIGTGAPLKDGEVLIPDAQIRTTPSSTPETIDEQKPLTHQKAPADGPEEDV